MKPDSCESLLAQWFRRVWNEADPSAIAELADTSVVSHGLVQKIQGREAWQKESYGPMRASFASIRVELLDEGVIGEMIFGRLSVTLVPKVTGEPVTMRGMCQMRIADGRIAEAWDAWDFLGLLESMKLLPSGSFGRAITGALERHPMA